jgi:hypothetical protein
MNTPLKVTLITLLIVGVFVALGYTLAKEIQQQKTEAHDKGESHAYESVINLTAAISNQYNYSIWYSIESEGKLAAVVALPNGTIVAQIVQ